MIEFSEEIGFWSKFTFWYVLTNAIITVLFTSVIIVGGIFDLKFLLNSLKLEVADDTDDGRVESSQENMNRCN